RVRGNTCPGESSANLARGASYVDVRWSMLEPDGAKVSSPVLRGGRGGNATLLPDQTAGARRLFQRSFVRQPRRCCADSLDTRAPMWTPISCTSSRSRLPCIDTLKTSFLGRFQHQGNHRNSSSWQVQMGKARAAFST